METCTLTGYSSFYRSVLKVRIEGVEDDTVCVVDLFHGGANNLCSTASTMRGFVNVFYPCSHEAGKRLSRARRRSVLAGLAEREGDLAETRLSDKNPSQDFLVHVGSCEKHLRAGCCDVYKLLLASDRLIIP